VGKHQAALQGFSSSI